MHRPVRFAILTVALILLATVVPTGAMPPDSSGAVSTAETQRYIIQLAGDPLATYDGSIAGLPATAPNAVARIDLARQIAVRDDVDAASVDLNDLPAVFGETRLDGASPAAEAYAAHLRDQQDATEAAIQRIAPRAEALFHYGVVFNGLTVRLAPAEAERVAALPGVLAVMPEELVDLRMDEANKTIHAVEAWQDSRIGGRANAGRGVRIGVIDSGIASDHAMFDDTGYTAPAGFPKASLRVGDTVTDYSPAEAAAYTNNKVIVSRVYVNPEIAPQLGGDANPIPVVGHGTHVAGIAGGNVVQAGPNPYGAGDIELSGVAPGAYLMAYRFDYAYTPEILRAVEDAVADGADVINNSWGTALMNITRPDAHPISVAFKNATAANVVIVAAAGNSGAVGEASLGGPHQMIDEVITVAASDTGRSFSYEIEAVDTGIPDDLRGFPAQYVDYGPESWSTIQAPVYTEKLCGDTDNSGAADRIVYVDFGSECDTPNVEVPAQLAQFFAPFTQQLAGAKLAGAKGVVLYSTDPDGIDQTALMMFMVVKMYLPQLVPPEFVDVPVTAVAAGEKTGQLEAWAAGSDSLEIKLNITPNRAIDPERADRAAGFTSRGPAPNGLKMKPDISAPGVNVLSALNTGGYVEESGTSMASPVVAGAVAVVRHAWPEWSPAEVKAALMITSDPVLKSPDGGSDLAPAMTEGAGRVNLARALDPGVLVSPPSINLGTRLGGQQTVRLTLRDVRQDASGAAIYTLRHEPGPGNDGDVEPNLPAMVPLVAGGESSFEVSFDLDGVAPGTYDGRIVLESTKHTVRVTYSVRIMPEIKDVLLMNVRTAWRVAGNNIEFYDTPDYGPFWTTALDEAELDYDVWTIAQDAEHRAPPLEVLQRYRLVIVAGGDSNLPLEALDEGRSTMTGLQMYLLGGGAMLADGNQWPHLPAGIANTQSNGSTHLLSRYFAGFHETDDDVAGVDLLQPAWYFEAPVRISDGGDPAAADNGGLVDLGKPLDAVDTAPRERGQPPAPDNSFAYLAADQIMPYIHGFLESNDGKSALTGVTNDARLELPEVGAAVSWRAMYAGFPIEAVLATEPDDLSRADLLSRIFDWAIEPDGAIVHVAAPRQAGMGADVTITATADLPAGFSGVKLWRWDAGDGREYVATDSGEITLAWDTLGEYTVRAEITSLDGHTYVGEALVDVREHVGWDIFLPIIVKVQAFLGR